MISSGGGISIGLMANRAPSASVRDGRKGLGPGLRDEDWFLTEERPDALLPHVARECEHHAGLEMLLGCQIRKRVGHQGKVEPQPEAPRDWHGRSRDPSVVV